MTPIYVIGHVNPDTDTIASAMGYAWLLRETGGEDAVAARAGGVNPQTAWVLKRLELQSPKLLNDASPRFESIAKRLDTTSPDSPLMDAWAIAHRTWGVAPVVNENGTPFGLVNGPSLFAYLNKMIGPHPKSHELRISEILEVATKEACNITIPEFQAGSRIRDYLNRILRQEGDDFWVVDEQGLYIGVCRQRDVLNPPRLRLILVDHNEPGQALGSLEEAELIEIIDHHRLGNRSTHIPIRFTIDVVGSTSTLISERIEEAGLSAPPELAGLMLAGCLSDTLMLSSPTTTQRDHLATERLGRWAFLPSGPLAGDTVESFGSRVMQAGSGLTALEPDEIVNTDMKLYKAGEVNFAIAQIEVTDLLQLEELSQRLFDALNALKNRRGLNFAMLMVTNVVRSTSRILLTDAPPELADLPYPRLSGGILGADGVVSRKKQLLPVVLGLLER